MTGPFAGYTREGAEAAIVARGGTSPGSVSKKTFCVVVGEAPGASKLTKARRTRDSHRQRREFESLLVNGVVPTVKRHAESVASLVFGRWRLRFLPTTCSSGVTALSICWELARQPKCTRRKTSPSSARVVVKVLLADLAAHESVRRAFRDRIIRASTLSHPHLARVFDGGQESGSIFMISEYLSGGSLDDVLAAGRRFSVDDGARLGRDVASALAYVHEQGFVLGTCPRRNCSSTPRARSA